MSDEPISISPSEEWTDDAWYVNQDDRHPIANKGWLPINEGGAKGRLVGGNLGTLNLLQGTEYMPDLEDVVLFLEDDEETNAVHLDRDLVSLIQQPGFSGVKGIVIGRFQQSSNISDDVLVQIIKSKKELQDLPILAGVDFGHTTPIITYPIGGSVELEVGPSSRITITQH